MGRKKKKPMKPWCWYCNREFDDEKILIQHQKAKHFKCHICYKKLYTGPGLAIHCMQVHKENIDKVPNALPGRQDIEIEIYGMEGIPDKDLAEHAAKANEQKRKERVFEQGGDAEDTPSSSAPVPQMGATPGMPPGVMGMQQRMPGMPPQPGMMPGMPPMMPGMPMPPGMPPGMRMPPFPMPPMGMPGMPPMPPGMFPPRPGMPGARMPVSTAGMPTSSQGGMPFGAGPGGAPNRHGGHGQQPKPLFPSAAPPSTAGSGPVGADFRPLSSQSGGSGGNRPPAIGPIKPTFPSAEYSSSPKNTSSGASTSKTSSQSSDDRSGSSSKPSSAASSVTKSGPSTSSTSKIVHPDEELSLEELRAQMSKYKKAAPPQVPAAARGPAPLPPVPGIGVPPTSQSRMPGNAPQVSVGLASRIQTPGVMGMQPQGQMAPRMGMPAHGAMQMNGQRMHQFPMGQGMMPGYGMPAMPGFPGAPHPGMMGGMPQRMPPQMGDHARMMQGGRY